MSILHRATGIANAAGLIAVVWWLVAAASGPGAYDNFLAFASHPVGKLMFLGWTFSIYLHMLSGIRHLIMDTGRLLNIKSSNMAVLFIWTAAVVLTAATWITIIGGVE